MCGRPGLAHRVVTRAVVRKGGMANRTPGFLGASARPLAWAGNGIAVVGYVPPMNLSCTR